MTMCNIFLSDLCGREEIIFGDFQIILFLSDLCGREVTIAW